jgi:flagellar biosynthesis/type III secretory pathway protein FliH
MVDDHRVQFGGQVVTFHAIKLLRLYQIPAAELLEQPALRALVALGEGPQVEHLIDARRRIEEERGENWRDLLAVLYVSASKVFPPDIYKAILFSEAIMEYPAIQEFLKMGEQRGLERGLALGLEQGREQGLEQGREQARTQLAREQLRDILSARFPGLEQQIPCEGLRAEQAIALFRVALTATSERDILAAL